MVTLETYGIRHAGLLPRASNTPADHNRGFANAGRLSRLSGCTRGWKRSASEMTSGRDKGWQGEQGAACEQVPRQAIYGMFHPRLADGLPCVGGRRCLRHTGDEAPGCDVWIGTVSAVIGLLLGGGVAPKLGSCVDLKGASFAGVIPGCCAPVGSGFVGTHSHSHRYLQGLGDSRRAMQCRSAASALHRGTGRGVDNSGPPRSNPSTSCQGAAGIWTQGIGACSCPRETWCVSA